MEIYNGTGKPRLLVTYNDTSTATVDLPFCQSLQERMEEIKNLHTMLDKSTEVDRIGIRWGCTLSYRKLMKGAVLASIGAIIRSDIDTIYITPRVDFPGRKYLVHWANRLQFERAFSQGHAGVELVFEGMESLQAIAFIAEPTDWPVVNDDDTTVIDDYDGTTLAS